MKWSFAGKMKRKNDLKIDPKICDPKSSKSKKIQLPPRSRPRFFNEKYGRTNKTLKIVDTLTKQISLIVELDEGIFVWILLPC